MRFHSASCQPAPCNERTPTSTAGVRSSLLLLSAAVLDGAAGVYSPKVPPGTPVHVLRWLPKVGPWTTLGPLTSGPVFGAPGRLSEHGWDLAVATGQVPKLDPALADAVLPVVQQMVPADARGGEMPFEAVIEVPPTASVYGRLAAYLGRQPR